MKPDRRKFYVMRWVCPRTGKPLEQSTKKANKKKAQDVATAKEHEIANAPLADVKMTWPAFKMQFESLYLCDLRASTFTQWNAATKALERKCDPKLLIDVNAAMLRTFASRRHADGIRSATIAKDIRHLRVALKWAAEEMEFIPKCPRFKPSKKLRGRKTQMRSRPINEAEFRKLLKAVPLVRPHDPKKWRRYLIGLWLSGLRPAESVALDWDGRSGFSVDASEEHLRFLIMAEAQKGDRDEYCPIAPGFARFLLKTPKPKRRGSVFFNGEYSAAWVKRIVSRIGAKAGVLVNRDREVFAGSQSLRRSFGSRWARRVMPAELKALMRHKNIATTMQYYVGHEASEVNRSIRRRKRGSEESK